MVLTLTGSVFREDDHYVGVIDAWGISTVGESVEDAIHVMWDMIDGHLEAAKKIGTLQAELVKAGVSDVPSDGADLGVAIDISVKADRRITL